MKEEKHIIFLFFLPSIIFLAVLFIYPFLYGFYLSFTNEEGEWTLENYLTFFKDPWKLELSGLHLK